MNDTLLAIAMVEPKSALKKLPADASLEERFRCAFTAVQHHWAVTDPEQQYRAGIAAVYSLANEDERPRIEAELQQLQTLNALLSGVPVDLERVEPMEDAVGIMRIWHEVAS